MGEHFLFLAAGTEGVSVLVEEMLLFLFDQSSYIVYHSFIEMITIILNGGIWTNEGEKQNSEEMEIIKEDFTKEHCNSMLNYPLKVHKAAGTNLKDGFILCGGDIWYNSQDETNECYSLENGNWKLLENTKLITARRSHGISTLGNYVWITGGLHIGIYA